MDALEATSIFVLLMVLAQPEHHRFGVNIARHFIDRDLTVPAGEGSIRTTVIVRLASISFTELALALGTKERERTMSILRISLSGLSIGKPDRLSVLSLSRCMSWSTCR